MDRLAAQLVHDLQHNAKVSGAKDLEQRLADTALWYYHNKHNIDQLNLAKKIQHQGIAIECLIEISALLLERIRATTGSKKLYLPAGIRMNDKEFT